jgi:hypothetical protein
MNVDRLQDVQGRLTVLFREGGDPAAIEAQLSELAAAIDELKKRPQKYIPIDIMQIPPHWKQWPDLLGYADRPYVRTDFTTIFKEQGKKRFYAKVPGGSAGTYLTDSRGRRRTWKHAVTAMHYIDRDFPSSDNRTWAEREIDDAGS